mgnify:CR=1 FL=1
MRPPLRIGTVYDFRNTADSGLSMPDLYAAIIDAASQHGFQEGREALERLAEGHDAHAFQFAQDRIVRAEGDRRVAFANVGRSLPRQFDCGHEAGEAVGLIGPHACFEPANLVVVEHVDGRHVEADRTSDARNRSGYRYGASGGTHDCHCAWPADRASWFELVLVAGEEQVQSCAGSDVDVCQCTHLAFEHAEHG